MENFKKREIQLSSVISVFAFLFISMWYTIVYIDSWVVQIPLIMTACFAGGVAFFHGYKWKDIIEAILYGVGVAMEGLLILLIIGMVIGSWVASGTVQTIIVYGLDILSPQWFLPATLIVSAATALATGSAWTTGGTVGVALMGIGAGLGINPAIVAGAVVSGAFFGDKLSPLSDNSNVVSAATGTNLFEHVKHTAWTAIPGFLIALVIYSFMGMGYGSETINDSAITETLSVLHNNFYIGPILLLPPILVLVQSYFKIPAIPSLLVATIAGSILAIYFQGIDISEMFTIIYSGFTGATGNAAVDKIVSRGGLASMYYNTSLAIAALALAGILEKTGMLKVLLKHMESLLRTRFSLVLTTMITSWLTNLAMASQHMAMIVPGRMYLPAYKKHNLKIKNLSRTLADSGGLSAPLVPWGLSGAFMAGALGVNTLEYAPYAIFCFIVPVIALIYAATGFKFEYETTEENLTTIKEEVKGEING